MPKILTLNITNETQVKFYYGKAENAGNYKDGGIYFAYDTAEIYLDGQSYCSGISGVTYDNDTFTFTLANGLTVTITLPIASEDNDGLLSKEDKTALDNLSTTLDNLIKGLVYNDTAETSEFVTAVSESDGVISVLRAALTSEDKTVTINGYDLHVNVDGDTITVGNDGKLSVVSSALTQYIGKDAIAISDLDTSNNKTISLVIEESEKVLSQSTSGLKTTLTVDYTSNNHMVNLKGIDGAIISSFDATEFIVDGMIQSAELVHENPDTGETGEFLAITFNTEGGETTTIYIDVAELIDTYTAGNGLALSDHEFSVKIADSSENFLTVDEAGIKLSGIQDAINSAVATEEARAETAEQSLSNDISTETSRAEAAEAALEEAIKAAVAGESTTVVEQGSSNEHITVSSSTSGVTTTYTINENDIASASDLIAETTRAEGVESNLLDAIKTTSDTTDNIIDAIGLNEDGTHASSKNYYANGETVESEITALDTEVYNIVGTNLTWHILD